MAAKNSVLIAPNVNAIRQPTEIDVAWIAGLYEGEGHAAGIKGRTISYISQKDPEILFRCRELFGGSITKTRATTDKYLHLWKMFGDHARLFYQAIYPFMSTRRKMQIEKASGLHFKGIVKSGKRISDPKRIAARSIMTLKQKMVESQLHYKKKNSAMVKAYQRDFARMARLKAKELAASSSVAKEQYDA